MAGTVSVVYEGGIDVVDVPQYRLQFVRGKAQDVPEGAAEHILLNPDFRVAKASKPAPDAPKEA